MLRIRRVFFLPFFVSRYLLSSLEISLVSKVDARPQKHGQLLKQIKCRAIMPSAVNKNCVHKPGAFDST